MDQLHWELTVLGRAVVYNNLSGAASHIGMSQPQLSRIVARIEKELGVVLLDRSARRKSGWTPFAHRLVETYSRSMRHLTADIRHLMESSELTRLSVGTLEGLIPLACSFCHHVFDATKAKVIELNVYDLNQLEDAFQKSDLDVIFTSREAGIRKMTHAKKLGYQTLQQIQKPGISVLSTFEYGRQATRKHKQTDLQPTVVSNSLGARKYWLDHFGGTGQLPSPLRKTKKGDADEVTIYLFASDAVSNALWEKIAHFKYALEG